MKTSEFYDQVRAAVIDEADVDGASLFASNAERDVDARHVLVHCLCRYLTDGEIVRLTGMSRSGVNKIRNTFDTRLRKFTVRCLCRTVEERARQLSEIFQRGG